MEDGVPDIPKIAPIIEIKETYFHQKPERFIAPKAIKNPGSQGYRGSSKSIRLNRRYDFSRVPASGRSGKSHLPSGSRSEPPGRCNRTRCHTIRTG